MVIPRLELFLAKIPYLPALAFKYLSRELLHLTGLGVKCASELVQVVVDCNLLLPEDVMKREKIFDTAERSRVNMAVSLQERFEFRVFYITFEIVIEFCHIKVFLCVKELIDIVFQVPLREVLSQPELASFEWSVVD